MSTNVGSFRHAIEIREASETFLSDGTRVETFDKLILSCRAKKRSVKADEHFVSDAQHVETVTVYTLRHSARVKNNMRVYEKGVPYEIREIIPLDDMKGFMQIRCVRVAPEAGEEDGAL